MEKQRENEPFFSIIVPVFNTQREFLDECMGSLLSQTYTNIEILIVDDGSCEECAKLCDGYSDSDKRIRAIHQKNAGVSAARNHGIKEAKAKWIMFVDADDWIDDDTCERLRCKLLSAQYDMLLFDHIKEYSNGKKSRRWIGFEEGKVHYTSNILVKEKLYQRAMGTPNNNGDKLSTIYYSWDKVFSREFLIDNMIVYPVGLPKSEDKVFILRCFEKMNAFYYDKTAFYHYRINELSASHRYSQNVEEERRKLSEYLEEIAIRMDDELSKLTNNEGYNLIYKDYMRFVFGIISDILFSKYYHKSYPYSGSRRKEEVEKFLKSEPFNTAIHLCQYADLDGQAKIKKFMLSHGLTTLFCNLRRIKRV